MKILIPIVLLLAGCAGGVDDRLTEATVGDLTAWLEQNHEQRYESREQEGNIAKQWAAELAEGGKYAEAIDVLKRHRPPLVTEQLLEKLDGSGLAGLMF